MVRKTSYKPISLRPLDAGIQANIDDIEKRPLGVLAYGKNARIMYGTLGNTTGWVPFSTHSYGCIDTKHTTEGDWSVFGKAHYVADLPNSILLGDTLASGTAKTGSSATKLVDGSVNFATAGVVVGDYVMNFTDGSYGIVTGVSGSTLTISSGMSSGANDAGDEYVVVDISSPASLTTDLHINSYFQPLYGSYAGYSMRITDNAPNALTVDFTIAASEGDIPGIIGTANQFIELHEFVEKDDTHTLFGLTSKSDAYWDSNKNTWRRISVMTDSYSNYNGLTSPGTASSVASSAVLTMANAGQLVVDDLIGCTLVLQSGAQNGTSFSVVDNDADTITLDSSLTNTESGLKWLIYRDFAGSAGWGITDIIEAATDYLVFGNTSDGLYYWTGPGPPNFPQEVTQASNGNILSTYENHLIVAGINGLPHRLDWSQPGDFDDFSDPTAGSLFFYDNTQPIVAVEKLGRELIVYKLESIYAMDFVGGITRFQVNPRSNFVGAISKHAVINFGEFHIFVGLKNVYIFDGLNVKEIGDQIKGLLDPDPDALDKVRAVYLKETNEIIIVYQPVGGSTANKAFRYNIVERKWTGPEDFSASAYGIHRADSVTVIDDITTMIDQVTAPIDSAFASTGSYINVFCNPVDNYIYNLSPQVYTRNGAVITMDVKFPVLSHIVNRDGIPVLDEELVKRIGVLEVRVSGLESGDTINAYVAVSDTLFDPAALSSSDWGTAFSIGSSPFRARVGKRGRYYAVRLVSTLTKKVVIEALTLYVKPAGFR